MKVIASLAAVLTLAAAGSASANTRVAWGDLDLSSATGADAFDARVEAAARKACRHARRPNSRITDIAYCRAAFRAEVLRQLPGSAKVDYALSRLPIVA